MIEYQGYCEKHGVKTVGIKCKLCAAEPEVMLKKSDIVMDEKPPQDYGPRPAPIDVLIRHAEIAFAMQPVAKAIDEMKSKLSPLRPKNSAERKAEPIHSGVMLYFPDALAAVARISKAGNDKHNPGEPLHWSRGKSMDHLDCMVRHSMTPEGIDPDSGEYEQAQVAWRALAQLQLLEEKRLKAAGIMPYSGIVP